MKRSRLLSLGMALLLCLQLVPAPAAAAGDVYSDTAAYLLKTVPHPQVGSVGGEWAVIGLARSQHNVPNRYFDDYYTALEQYVKGCGGVLHRRKYTEYSRVILAVTAIGRDATNVGGYDLTKPLNDYGQTIWQGINGPVWALIALDSGSYSCSARQQYVDCILSHQLPDGGWDLADKQADPDMTGMALQALARYQNQKNAAAAIDRALAWLSGNQNRDGSFSVKGLPTCESTVQVLVALTELGIPLSDSRFVKDGHTVLDGLMTFYTGSGSFSHVAGGGSGNDGMATEQAFYGLVAARRAEKNENSLYTMAETPKASFPDIQGHPNQIAIDALVEKGVINGKGDGTFSPDSTMTRAQFCTIIVKALGLTPQMSSNFSDVSPKAWYTGFVGAAYAKGLVNGVGQGLFAPESRITRQEAAVMMARAAKLLGIPAESVDTDSILSSYPDGRTVAIWARVPVAYCLDSGIWGMESGLQPQKAILRCEIAQMVYNMLGQAGRL